MFNQQIEKKENYGQKNMVFYLLLENLCKTVVNFSSLYLCRRISDGLILESSELDDVFSLLLINVVDELPDVIVADGDGGDSVVIVGDSICGPMRRRAVFGGGLIDSKKKT